ncbi:MAG: response regulator transcription factor [Deltaproteobacteria bacterium]|nr:response regulator transcription factor [Deltaproteobacteria bacterium]
MTGANDVSKLRALVLEDERHARSYLVELVEASGLGHVVAAVPTPDLASEALDHFGSIDVAFVDVHLVGAPSAEVAGLGWIEQLRSRPEPPVVVVTTAAREHALRAFELGATDYLLKPFVAARVVESLGRVRDRRPARTVREERPPARIVARKGRGLVFLEPGEAWAFEAEGRLCHVHAAEGRFDVDLSLSALEAVLGDAFLRVHRNWLVSLGHVRQLERDDGEAVLVVGEPRAPRTIRIGIARDRVAAVRERLLSATVGLRRED